MTWWNDLWIKEGFSTYLAVTAIENLYPGEGVMDLWQCDAWHRVLSVDSLMSTHPVVGSKLEHPNDIRQMFDAISYLKGAMLVRMMERLLGADKFNKGMEYFLNTFEYSSVNHTQLWISIIASSEMFSNVTAGVSKESKFVQFRSQAGNLDSDTKQKEDVFQLLETKPEACNRTISYYGQNVVKFINSWTKFAGYPLLIIDRNYENGSFNVTQRRWISKHQMSQENNPEGFVGRWWIPIEYESPMGKSSQFLVGPGAASIDAHAPGDTWLLVHSPQLSPCVINYDLRNWEMLLSSLDSFQPAQQVNLMANAFHLAKGGYVPYNALLSVVDKKLTSSSADCVWASVIHSFSEIELLLRNTNIHTQFKKWVGEVMWSCDPLQECMDLSSGFSARRICQRQLRILTQCRHEEFLRNATDLAKEALLSKHVPRWWKEARVPVLGAALSTRSGDHLWRWVWAKCRADSSHCLLSAVAATSDLRTLSRLLKSCLDSKSGLRKQDGVFLFKEIARNPEGSNIALEFLVSKWANINMFFGSGSNKVSSMVLAFSHLSSESHLEKLMDLKIKIEAEHETHAALRSISSLIESIKINIEWVKFAIPEIRMFLENI